MKIWSIVILLFISGTIICLIIENIIRLPESVVVTIAALFGCPYLVFKDLIFNGASIGKKTAPDHFFYFDVKNEGETTILAKA